MTKGLFCPHLPCGEIQLQGVKLHAQGHTSVGAEPQLDLTVRRPSSPPWLSKQNAQGHQIRKKSPRIGGKSMEASAQRSVSLCLCPEHTDEKSTQPVSTSA